MENADRGRIAFYEELGKEADGPVLELGCGTGLVTVALALAGCEVVAFDSSARLVDQALERRRALGLGAERCQIERGDLRSLRLRRRFGLVCAPANALQALSGMEDLLAVFATARAHLQPGGRFAFDVRVDPTAARGGGLADPERSGLEWREMQARRPHLSARSRDGQPATVHRLLLLGLGCDEIEEALGEAGFELLERYGGFAEEPFRPEGRQLVVVAQARR